MLFDNQTMLTHNDNNFSLKVMVDSINQRLWVWDYSLRNGEAFSQYLKNKASMHSAAKIIIPARRKDLGELIKHGYLLEGTAEGFFNGKDAFFMASYPEPTRRQSDKLEQKMNDLRKILASPKKLAKKLPPGYSLRFATTEDATELAKLFNMVFSTYPTPLNNADYICELMNNDTIFILTEQNGAIIAAAAAEIDSDNSNAEMTNCATNPSHQGLGLMHIIMEELQRTVLDRNIKCLYSLSRASEYGINLILHRMGYTYSGTLINNCHISGQWEDMHLWVLNSPHLK
ncbi:putative beta-lysine N-acetyltransferase [Desulfofalx alkaliphila]|uniref:putative beta-lysine N-acetyltransferase n=1 Tax=Desulfofalx alkaliphila TaxID=105483 RepID=UPI0004E26155|nr:putative beta-lysine N-acetyltransferase [Desulfofalx alkaliphila]